MEWIIPFVVVLVIFVMITKKRVRAASKPADNEHRYRQRKTLFTAAERSFLGVLDSIIDPTQHRIFGKDHVADLIEPEPNRNRSQWQKAFNRISAKHFDFVICNADDLTPLCAIELDDASHKQNSRAQRDELLKAVCEQAGLSLLRIPAKRAYQKADIEAQLAEALAGVEKPQKEQAESVERASFDSEAESGA